MFLKQLRNAPTRNQHASLHVLFHGVPGGFALVMKHILPSATATLAWTRPSANGSALSSQHRARAAGRYSAISSTDNQRSDMTSISTKKSEFG
ncbi:hypothetical protein [Cupriavidus taiwanensis]|uniref:hypothetical protein n=1 Tax=Cupriavidus taiwanensis TaxID=164546 RepID=UPI0015F26653|nr:hypothetical protein [Cupriavidus taiwanensis]